MCLCITVVLVLSRLKQKVQCQPRLHGKILSKESNHIKPKPQNNPSSLTPPQIPRTNTLLYTGLSVSALFLLPSCHPVTSILLPIAGCPSHSVAISLPISLFKCIFHALPGPATSKEKWIHMIASDQ